MSTLLEQASLVMIPSGYKEDIVYSQIPTNGNGDLSFTRASNGTRVNSAGLVEVTPWNLLQYSEDFGNAYWTKASVTIASNSINAPNGTLTADLITVSSNNAEHNVYGVYAITPNETYTFSYYVKKGTARYFCAWMYLSGKGPYATFDLNTGLLVANGAVNGIYVGSSIESLNDGWYRISVSGYGNYSTAIFACDVRTAGSLVPEVSWLGAGETGYLWGAQVNIGSTAKPYFPTTDRLNVPRLTYQNGGGGCPSLLLEKQSTNLVTYSEQFDNAAWTKNYTTVTANTTTSPDGTQNADSMTENTAYDHHLIYQGSTVSAGAYTQSVFIKKNTRQYAFLQIATDTAVNRYTIVVDLDNGSVTATSTAGSPTGTSNKIDSMGNGWYRVTVTATHTSGEVYSVFGLSDSANPTFSGVATPIYTGNGTGSIYIYGAQIEASSYPTSYIPTTSASATRVADFTSRSGLGLTNFTFAVNFKPLDYIVELFDFQKTGGGRMFYVAVQSSGFITFNSVSGGTIGAIGSIIPKLQTCKLAFKLNASTSDLTVFINGSNIGTYTTDITTFGQFLGLQSFGYNPGTQIEQIAIFPSVLTDAECISLTTI